MLLAGPRLKVPTTGTSSPEVLAEAAALSGPPQPAGKACDLALALGLVSEPGGLGSRDAMLAAVATAWPGDPAGVLALLLMEDVVLQRGESILIPAGCPHAYVCGEGWCLNGEHAEFVCIFVRCYAAFLEFQKTLYTYALATRFGALYLKLEEDRNIADAFKFMVCSSVVVYRCVCLMLT